MVFKFIFWNLVLSTCSCPQKRATRDLIHSSWQRLLHVQPPFFQIIVGLLVSPLDPLTTTDGTINIRIHQDVPDAKERSFSCPSSSTFPDVGVLQLTIQRVCVFCFGELLRSCCSLMIYNSFALFMRISKETLPIMLITQPQSILSFSPCMPWMGWLEGGIRKCKYKS